MENCWARTLTLCGANETWKTQNPAKYDIWPTSCFAGDNASLLDLRYFADTTTDILGTQRTLIGVQCKGQDQGLQMSIKEVFEAYDNILAMINR